MVHLPPASVVRLLVTLALCFIQSVSAQIAGGETPAPSPLPETSSPTFTETCYVCGDANLVVDRSGTVSLGDDTFQCTDIEAFGLARLASPLFCDVLMLAAMETCSCAPRPAVTAAPTPAPAGGTTSSTLAPTITFAPTLAPSFSEPCYVCGDPDLFVDPTRTVTLGEDTFTCADVEEEFNGSQVFSPSECDLLAQLIFQDCRCMSLTQPTEAPVAAAPPKGSDEVQQTASSSSGPNSAIYALAALVLIPIGIGVYCFCWKRQRSKATGSKKDGLPALYTSDDVGVNTTQHKHPQAQPDIRTPRSSSSNEVDTRLHSRKTEQEAQASKRSRRISARDPPSSPSSSAPRSSQRPSAGVYMPSAKDQCRTVIGNAGEPIMVEAVPIPMNDRV